MDNLTNIIEAILFASGKAVSSSELVEKLGVSREEIKIALDELALRYGDTGGICLLRFNGKSQLCTNPAYRTYVESVLNSIREKELTRTVLECAAIIAYKQPITKAEIELLRGLNSDYAVHVLLELGLICPCGKKDAVGRPNLYATTDEFLKRFRLTSLEDLPDYDELMSAINRSEEDRDSYLYAREELPEARENKGKEKGERSAPEKREEDELTSGYEIPDFLRGLDDTDIVKIS